MRCNSRGKGESILFIHGMPTNGCLWDDVVRNLAPHFRCFVVDLPGMGRTPFMPYSPAYFAQVAAQIEQVRVRNHVRRWHVVGHDGGCAVAIHYAHLFPQRINCMALLSPALFPDLKPFFLLEWLRKPVVGEITAPLVHTLFWKVAMRRSVPRARQRSKFHETFAGLTGPWRLMRLVRWGKPEILFRDCPSILQSLTRPTLVIHASRDILPSSFAHRAAAMISNSELIEMDSGHFLPIERSTDIAVTLLSYFRSRGIKRMVNSPINTLLASTTRIDTTGLTPVNASQSNSDLDRDIKAEPVESISSPPTLIHVIANLPSFFDGSTSGHSTITYTNTLRRSAINAAHSPAGQPARNSRCDGISPRNGKAAERTC